MPNLLGRVSRKVKPRIRNVVKRSVILTCLYYVLNDWWSGRRFTRGNISTTSGTRTRGGDLEDHIDHALHGYKSLLKFADLEHFSGVVAEIGPGDNFALGLLVLSGGALEFHAVDRFRSERDPERERTLYSLLAEKLALEDQFDGAPAENTIRGLHYHTGVPAEEYFRTTDLRFDSIISRATLEHLYDPLSALWSMAQRLRPSGLLVHQINLRDHGMFAPNHPLTFLTVPNFVYRRMTRHSGRPNRMLYSGYKDWLEMSGLDGSMFITHVLGREHVVHVEPCKWEEIDLDIRECAIDRVRKLRSLLQPPFDKMPEEMLAITGCALVARKPEIAHGSEMHDRPESARDAR